MHPKEQIPSFRVVSILEGLHLPRMQTGSYKKLFPFVKMVDKHFNVNIQIFSQIEQSVFENCEVFLKLNGCISMFFYAPVTIVRGH